MFPLIQHKLPSNKYSSNGFSCKNRDKLQIQSLHYRSLQKNILRQLLDIPLHFKSFYLMHDLLK